MAKRSAHDWLEKPYSHVLIPIEDGSFSAQILEFPGCFAEGATPDEAIQNLKRAAASWVEAAREQGQEIPEPLVTHGYSGKINLRLPRSIHKQAARFAQKEDVSLNQFFTSAIAARVGAEDLYNRLIERIENRITQQATTITLQQFLKIDYWPLPGAGRVAGQFLSARLEPDNVCFFPSRAMTDQVQLFEVEEDSSNG